MTSETFAWYDYLLFAGVLAISLGIGAVFAFTGGRQRTTGEYLTANRNLGILPVALSMYMSFTSGIMVLGNTAEMYTFGIQMWLVTCGYAIAYVLGAVWFLPLFFKLKLTSTFEYFELRYTRHGKAVRKVGSILSIISGILYSGLAMYSPATSLEAVTPIPYWASIIAMGVIGTIYTTIGGIKAVVWTDAFQGVAMFIGVLTVCILGVQEIGTVSDVWDINREQGRIWTTFDTNPFIRMSFWSAFVGGIVSGISTTGTAQPSVQRYVSMKSMRHAFIAALLCIPLHMMFYTMTFVVGGAMFAYYHLSGCDPYRSGQVSNTNQLFTYFVLNGLQRPAFPGLITAVLICGALSSFSSSMNSNAAVTWKDFLEGNGPFNKMTETAKTWTNKVLTLIYGCLSIAMAFAYTQFPGNAMMVSRSIARSAGSPILGMFILAAFFPFTNGIGVIVGACVGFAMHLTIGLGNSLYDPWPRTLNTTVDQCPANITIDDSLLYGKEDEVPTFFQMSFQWHDPWGTTVTIVIGIIISLITGPNKPSEQDPRYIIPVFDRLLCCFPVSCLKRFWCGVDHHPNLTEQTDKVKDTSGVIGTYRSFEDTDRVQNGISNGSYEVDRPPAYEATMSHAPYPSNGYTLHDTAEAYHLHMDATTPGIKTISQSNHNGYLSGSIADGVGDRGGGGGGGGDGGGGGYAVDVTGM